MRIPIPIVGQAYQHRAVDLAAQTCKNYFPEFNKEAENIVSLQPWPGMVAIDERLGEDGGMVVFDGLLYRVIGRQLYSVSHRHEFTEIGEIRGGGRCSFASNGIELIIVRANHVYTYDKKTLTLANDIDFGEPTFVAVLNNQALYDVDDKIFQSSTPGNLTEVSGLDYASLETLGDRLRRVFVFKESVLLFGEKGIEQWWNSGVGNPPFDRVQSGLIEPGTLAPWSIAKNKNYTYFLGSDLVVYRLAGSQVDSVSTIPISQEIQNYPRSDDAIGHCFSWDGQEFYYLKFPNGKAWCYSESANSWFELTTSITQQPYTPTSIVRAYNRVYLGYPGGTSYLDVNTASNNGETIVRERVSAPVTARAIGQPFEGRKLAYSAMEINVKAIGNVGDDPPTIMMSYSDNGGRTWSNERFLRARRLGEYKYKVRTQQLGAAYERRFRIRVSDSVFHVIESATADVEMGVDR